MKRIYIATLSIAILSFLPRQLRAQTIIDLDTEVTSQKYVLEIRKILEIGMNESISPVSLFSDICQDDQGRFYIGPTQESSTIAVFSNIGRELITFGRSGSGPGEFARIDQLGIGSNDSLYVYDVVNMRFSVFSDFEFVRSFPFQSPPHNILPISDGRLIVQSYFRGSDTDGSLLHLLKTNGEPVLSFCELESDFQLGKPWFQYRSVAVADDERIWSAHWNRHQIELWSLGGELQKILKGDPGWFQPWEEQDGNAPMFVPPKPHIASIQQDSAGRLWILSRISGQEWERLELGDNPRAMPGLNWINKTYDTVVEVIDPLSGELLLLETIPRNRAEFIGTGLIAEKTERSDGDGLLIIWQLILKAP